jgi:hypothetical protein
MIEHSSCCTVGACRFVNGSALNDDSVRGIYCTFGGGEEDVRGVMACVFHPNSFLNTKVAIDVEKRSTNHEALDCVVFPQYVEPGTPSGWGQLLLPAGVADNGVVVVGNRGPGTSRNQGVCIPAVANTAARPALTQGGDQGYVMYDLAAGSLVFWDGQAWETVDVI